jgi:hypothetical protein
MPAKATTKARETKARPRTRPAIAPKTRATRTARTARKRQATMPDPVSGVLERLGRAISAGDLPGVAACFAYPALLLTGADTHEFRDPQQVQVAYRKSLAEHGSAGIVTMHVELEEARALGGGVFECTVRWPAFSIDGRQVANERAKYLIQETTTGTALIRVGVAIASSGRDAVGPGGAVAAANPLGD